MPATRYQEQESPTLAHSCSPNLEEPVPNRALEFGDVNTICRSIITKESHLTILPASTALFKLGILDEQAVGKITPRAA
jgi:hypothetical protein